MSCEANFFLSVSNALRLDPFSTRPLNPDCSIAVKPKTKLSPKSIVHLTVQSHDSRVARFNE